MISAEPIYQIYRDAVRGANDTEKRDALQRFLDVHVRDAGLSAVCFHGFFGELGAAWERLAGYAAQRGLSAVASWGGDTSRFTGAQKGAQMGDVAARATCAASLLDAEGQWDSSTGPDDKTDDDDALRLGEELRKLAPRALVGDQCWFAIQSHGDTRTRPGPHGPRDVFRGFPVDEFARSAVSWFQFRQAYCNEAGFKRRWGTARYEQIFAWMDRDWAPLEAAFKTRSLHYKPGVTVQTYLWDDVTSDLMHCLLKYCAQLAQPIICWSDPFPTEHFRLCVAGLKKLQREGFAQPARSPNDGVRAYQRAFNVRASADKQLVVDGLCGLKTLGSMGLKLAE